MLLAIISSLIVSGCQPLAMGPSVNPNQFPTNAVAKEDFICDAGPMLGPSLMEIKKGTTFPVTQLGFSISDGTRFSTSHAFPENALGVPFSIEGNVVPSFSASRTMIIYPNGVVQTCPLRDEQGYCTWSPSQSSASTAKKGGNV